MQQDICIVSGKDFEQYLPLVMGPVMKTASMKPEVAVFDNEDMGTIDGDADWQFVSLGEQQNFGIRTAGESPYSRSTSDLSNDIQ